MAKIEVLIEGYAKKLKGGWLASSTSTLVNSNGKNIIVDPGCNRQKLVEELSKRNLKPADIDFVLLTHSHLDHTQLAGIFQNAKIFNYEEIHENDLISGHHGKIPETDLEIIQTPGHSDDHCSLIVKVDEMTYAIVGDLFWWMESEEQKVDINKLDQAHACNMEKLVESRKKILETADWIIPGHGKMFRVEKQI